MKALGIVLIIVGIVMIIFREVSFTREKEVADIGPLEINTKEKEKVSWPTYAGIAVAVGGVIVLLTAGRKKTA